MRTTELYNFIKSRHDIYERRKVGQKKPWTEDKILQSFRFCNMYRELDTVTEWIRENWRKPHRENPDLWFAMMAARLFNLPSTLEYIGFPVILDISLKARLHELEAKGKVFNSAYIVSTNGRAMNKIDYLWQDVICPAWERRAEIRPKAGDTLASFAKRVQSLNGMAGFMTGQVVCDTKYVEPLRGASDWWTWAVSGPGSRRGLNRVMGWNKDAPWREIEWHRCLMVLSDELAPLMKIMPSLHSQDLQNCLCEFDKYERVRLGEGRPKNTYPGGGIWKS